MKDANLVKQCLPDPPSPTNNPCPFANFIIL